MNWKKLNTVLAIIIVVLGVYIFIKSWPREVEVLGQPQSTRAADYFHRHNTYRAEHDLPILQYDLGLSKTAEMKSKDLCDNDYWSHDRPNGEKFSKIIYEHTGYRSVGENLARGQTTPSRIMQAWLESPEHLSNISGDWKTMGVGIYDCPSGKTYITTHFGG